MREVAHIGLDNEMDLILAHKRAMKLAELCGLSLPGQTTFATAVSEIARCSIAHGKNSALVLGIRFQRGGKKDIYAAVTDDVDLSVPGSEAFSYARRLINDVEVQHKDKGWEFVISQKIPFPGTISETRIDSFINYFKYEAPLSPYDEIRKKNIQLIELSEKLTESENRYRQLTDTLPLLIFSINHKNEIAFANKSMQEYLPRTFTSFTPAALQQVLHPDDSTAILQKWEQSRRTGSGFSGQVRIRYKDSYVWHLMTVAPQNKEQEETTTWTGFFVDIHAQKLVADTLKDNQELRQAQQQLITNQTLLEEKNRELVRQSEFVDTIVNSSVDAVILLDSDLTILKMNPAASALYAHDDSLVGSHISAIYDYTNGESIGGNLQRALAGENVHDRNYWCELHKMHFEIFYIPVKDRNNKVYQILMTGHDITFTIQAESKLKAYNEELSLKNRELEQFAYIASHDLQEPLRKIRNFTSLAERGLSAEQRKSMYFDKINASAAKMSNLIRDVLDYSRLSMQEAVFEDVDLNVVLKDVLTDFEFAIGEKKAEVLHDTLPVVKGIPVQLNQLVYNIVGNSLKFSTVAPRISIRYTAPANELAGNYHTLFFEDNGIGIEEQYANKIFTIFQRLHTPSEYEGTGIGLALCKRIVDNHSGNITVKSEPGKGSTFIVRLPALN